MQDFIFYDEALEERIRADREVQVVIEKLVSHAFAAWNRLPRRVARLRPHPNRRA